MYMDIDIDSARRTREICWSVFLFKRFKSQVRAMEKSSCDELHGRRNKVGNVLHMYHPVNHIWREIGKFLPLTIEFMSFGGACIFEGLTLILPHTLYQECFRRGSVGGCSQHRHGGKDRRPVLPTCLPASQDHIQFFPESKPLNSLRHFSQYMIDLCSPINWTYTRSISRRLTRNSE